MRRRGGMGHGRERKCGRKMDLYIFQPRVNCQRKRYSKKQLTKSERNFILDCHHPEWFELGIYKKKKKKHKKVRQTAVRGRIAPGRVTKRFAITSRLYLNPQKKIISQLKTSISQVNISFILEKKESF